MHRSGTSSCVAIAGLADELADRPPIAEVVVHQADARQGFHGRCIADRAQSLHVGITSEIAASQKAAMAKCAVDAMNSLTGKQRERLSQIALQIAGVDAFLMQKLSDELELTKEPAAPTLGDPPVYLP